MLEGKLDELLRALHRLEDASEVPQKMSKGCAKARHQRLTTSSQTGVDERLHVVVIALSVTTRRQDSSLHLNSWSRSMLANSQEKSKSRSGAGLEKLKKLVAKLRGSTRHEIPTLAQCIE